jgi:hypothetical protein
VIETPYPLSLSSVACRDDGSDVDGRRALARRRPDRRTLRPHGIGADGGACSVAEDANGDVVITCPDGSSVTIDGSRDTVAKGGSCSGGAGWALGLLLGLLAVAISAFAQTRSPRRNER